MERPAAVNRSRTRIFLIAALAIGAGILAWVLTGGGEDPPAPAPAPPRAGAGPELATAGSLSALQDKLGHSVYWAGAAAGERIELTRALNGGVFVRYLPDGVVPADPRPDFLTVATYPVEDADGKLEAQARRRGSVAEETPDGAVVVADGAGATSAYLAYPEQDLQIEVFDPDPGRALELAASGEVRPAD